MNATDWSRYADCYTCGVDPGEQCQATHAKHGLLWRPGIKRPHRGRELAETKNAAPSRSGVVRAERSSSD